MNFSQQVRLWWRRWPIIGLCFLVAVAVAAVFSFQQTPVYESHTRLFVSSKYGSNARAYEKARLAQDRVVSYADLATTNVIARRVIDRLQLNMTSAELSSDIQATPVPDTVLFMITVQNEDPKRAQALAQTVSETLATFVSQLESFSNSGRVPLVLTIVDSANLPATPTSPLVARNLILAAVLGLLIGLVAANLLGETAAEKQTGHSK